MLDWLVVAVDLDILGHIQDSLTVAAAAEAVVVLAALVVAEVEPVLVRKRVILAHPALVVVAVADLALIAVFLDSMLVETADLVQLYLRYQLSAIRVRHLEQL
jgi:hypothetical protein